MLQAVVSKNKVIPSHLARTVKNKQWVKGALGVCLFGLGSVAEACCRVLGAALGSLTLRWQGDFVLSKRLGFRVVREHCLSVQEERMSIQKETLDVLDISSASVTYIVWFVRCVLSMLYGVFVKTLKELICE